MTGRKLNLDKEKFNKIKGSVKKFWYIPLIVVVLVVALVIGVGKIPPKGANEILDNMNSYITNESYLSERALVSKLMAEGYDKDAVIYAVDKYEVDWNAQAINYVNNLASLNGEKGYSYKGLVEEMKGYGFEQDDAINAIEKAGINWYEQVIKAHKFYTERITDWKDEGYTIEKWLKKQGFSKEEVEYAVKYYKD